MGHETLYDSDLPEEPADEISARIEVGGETKEDIQELKEEVQTSMGKNPRNALDSYKDYQGLFNEEELKNLFMNYVIPRISVFDVEPIISKTGEYKDSLPSDVLQALMERMILVDPVSMMSSYALYKDVPKSKEVFNKAALNLLRSNPAKALRILTNQEAEYPLDNSEDYVTKAAEWAIHRNPTIAVDCFDAYKHLKNAKELEEIARRRALVINALLRTTPIEYPDDEGAWERKLTADPALDWVQYIERSWLPRSLSDREFGEFVAMICRNLYLKDKSVMPTKKKVREEYHAILALRDKYRKVPLFQGRNVIVVSHLERNYDGTPAFANEAFCDIIRKQQGEKNEFYHYKANDKSETTIEETKQEILTKIESMPSPMTFLFHGHGGGYELGLTGGQVGFDLYEDFYGIAVDDLARALQERSKRLGKDGVSQDILVFLGCYSHTFIRNLHEKLDALKSEKPIMLGESEYGQLTLLKGGAHSSYGEALFDELFKKDSPTTLGDVWGLSYFSDFNPSLYIPVNNIPQQITQVSPDIPRIIRG